MEGDAKIGLSLAAINQQADANKGGLERFERIQHLTNRSPGSEYIIDDQRALTGLHLKAPAQGAMAGPVGVVFYKDATYTKLACYFVGQDDAACGGANDDLNSGRAKVFGQRPAEPLGMLRPLQHLELFPIGGAVPTGGELEVALQHRARCAEYLLNFLLAQSIHACDSFQ